jgi:guanylate kinase
MGNHQSPNWQEEYELVESVSANHQRVRRKDSPNGYYELYTIFLQQEDIQLLLDRVAQRQKDKNVHVQRLLHCSQND